MCPHAFIDIYDPPQQRDERVLSLWTPLSPLLLHLPHLQVVHSCTALRWMLGHLNVGLERYHVSWRHHISWRLEQQIWQTRALFGSSYIPVVLANTAL